MEAPQLFPLEPGAQENASVVEQDGCPSTLEHIHSDENGNDRPIAKPDHERLIDQVEFAGELEIGDECGLLRERVGEIESKFKEVVAERVHAELMMEQDRLGGKGKAREIKARRFLPHSVEVGSV